MTSEVLTSVGHPKQATTSRRHKAWRPPDLRRSASAWRRMTAIRRDPTLSGPFTISMYSNSRMTARIGRRDPGIAGQRRIAVTL